MRAKNASNLRPDLGIDLSFRARLGAALRAARGDERLAWGGLWLRVSDHGHGSPDGQGGGQKKPHGVDVCPHRFRRSYACVAAMLASNPGAGRRSKQTARH